MLKIAREAQTRMKSFASLVLRKIRKVEYKNVHLIPGYENTEKEYLAMRNALDETNSMIKSLMNYEHGNRYLKAFKIKVQALSDKTSMNLYKSKDIYQEMALVTRRLGMMNLSSETKSIADKMSGAFLKLADSKIALNERLESVRLQLKEKRKQCFEIDRMRKGVKNMRFDLEVLLQDNGYNNEIRDAEKKEFSSFSNQTLKLMIQFIEDSSVAQILKSIGKEYSSHLKESTDILKKSGAAVKE